MKIIASLSNVLDSNVEVVYVPVFEEFPKYASKELPEKVVAKIKEAMNDKKFEGKLKQCYSVYWSDKKTFIAMGVGKKEDYNSDKLRQVCSSATRCAVNKKVKSYAFFLDGNLVDVNLEKAVQSFSESTLLSLYKFNVLKTKDKNNENLKEIVILLEHKKLEVASKAIKESQEVVESISRMRDLVNLPPNIVNPSYIVNEAKKVAKKYKLKCTVLGRKEIEKNNLNLLKAVSLGSDEEPALVVLEYNGAKNKKPVVLVGKGITYDSGGLNIKPYIGRGPAMRNMKTDMAGSALMFATIEAAARLRLDCNVVAVLALSENMINGRAYKCDDVVKSHAGLTVEITNTDAEGRLVLADALSYSKKFSPSYIINAATLTGASMLAVGYMGACLMGNDKELLEKLQISASCTGERLWELPLWEEYNELLDSSVADLKNSHEAAGPGTVVAGMFLQNFVEGMKWAHLDIASVSTTEKDRHFTKSGSTGFGVRLLVDFLKKQ
jgi:leucyl aminopeptidase